MQSWALRDLDVPPHEPQILTSTDEGRAIAIELPAGDLLQEHQVHERSWLLVVSGEIEVRAGGADAVTAGEATLLAFDPGERHEVRARSAARLLLLLTPWPGEGHPGAMSLDAKRAARDLARERSDAAS